MIFNKNNNGGEELRELLGFLDSSTNFGKWTTWIDLSVRQVTALTGKGVYDVVDAHYNSDNYLYVPSGTPSELSTPKASEIKAWKDLDILVRKFQLANALFAYVRLLPSLDAQHSNSGRKKTVGETERSLTAVEAYKDESNILNLGYEALEELISFMEETSVKSWLDSTTRKSTANLLVPDLDTFNEYFRIGSARLFYTLVPMIKEVQNAQLVPVITALRLTAIMEALKVETPSPEQTALITLTQDYIRRPLILATMALALKRLPVELLPEGIVQTQIVGTVKEKLVANEKTRQILIESLESDVSIALTALQDRIALLDGANKEERYVEGARVVEGVKGFYF